MNTPMTVQERRAYFPRGMHQPRDGYRFSLDALLLASFARVPNQGKGLDLGCGCGVVGTALLLPNPGRELFVRGIDFQLEMVECAQKNAREMGWGERLVYEEADVSAYADSETAMDFVLANPPYRKPGRGKTSPGESRQAARFESEAGLQAFCKTATRSLKDKAPLFVVQLPERLAEVVDACTGAGLTVKRVRFVHSRANEPARIMLVEARKNGGEGMVVESPLVLYEGIGATTQMTGSALAFCPFLQCNSD